MAVGVVDPIPTCPPVVTVTRVILLVSNASELLSLVPSVAVVPNELPPCTYALSEVARVEVDTHEVDVPVLTRIVPDVPDALTPSKNAPVNLMFPSTESVCVGVVVPSPRRFVAES